MGFWQGFNEGLTQVMADKTRKRELEEEREFRRQEIAEQRAYDRESAFWRANQERITASIPLLVERRSREQQEAQKRQVFGTFFETRMSDKEVPSDVKTAFTNLALTDTAYAESLIEAVKDVEGKTGRRLTGNELIKFSNLLEQTKPEGLSIEEWAKQAATMTVTSGSRIDYDETLSRLLSGEVSPEEVMQIQMDLMTPTGASLGIVPDFNTPAVVGPDPQRLQQEKALVLDEMKRKFQDELEAVQGVMAEFEEAGVEVPEDVSDYYKSLERVNLSEDKESAIFNFYAPTFIPMFAERYPNLKYAYPEYFTEEAEGPAPAPVITYEYVNGELVQR